MLPSSRSSWRLFLSNCDKARELETEGQLLGVSEVGHLHAHLQIAHTTNYGDLVCVTINCGN